MTIKTKKKKGSLYSFSLTKNLFFFLSLFLFFFRCPECHKKTGNDKMKERTYNSLQQEKGATKKTSPTLHARSVTKGKNTTAYASSRETKKNLHQPLIKYRNYEEKL